MTITFTIPVVTKSESNQREHWAAKAKRAKTQRGAARLLTHHTMTGIDLRCPLRITLTRIAPRALDGDNLGPALKAVRDGVAEALGFANDRESPRLWWRHRQRRGGTGEYAVEVAIAAGMNK